LCKKTSVLGLIVQKATDNFDPADLAKGIEKPTDGPWQGIQYLVLSLGGFRAILVTILDQVGKEGIHQRR
jgi:hypothetical protein